MTGADFSDEISSNLQAGESVEDIAMMIDTLVASRRGFLRVNNYFFAATILCILLRPAKDPEFRAAIQEMRLAFRGIAGDSDLQEGFANAILDALRTTEDVEKAMQLPITKLFDPRYIRVPQPAW